MVGDNPYLEGALAPVRIPWGQLIRPPTIGS